MGSCGTSGGMAGRRHAAMLGIGTANPTGVLVPQDVFAENLFRVTNSDHLPELKEKLRRICEKSGIERRHFHLTEETLAAHPELFDRELPSLDTRVDMTADAVPKLAQTEHALGMRVSGGGVDFHLAIQVPTLVGQNVEQCLLDAFRSAIVDDDDGGAAPPPSPCSGNGNGRWNDLFWAVHPGGRPILDNINKVLMLEPEKLAASRHVLREYGNMSGATIVFVLDELRRGRSPLPEWGALLAFGPGITIEAMVLRCPR
ncbi:unnamed protein product [Triticum turgidum subsp. durum]|uniref:Chalcone synthase n=1 Tax=Triticum turgidum subsp. durum TaxID=4567 RepID=A0A9R1AE83_TRITD|nr:unnamed protein product [Triticum turgidum subsp. durum]